MALAQCLYLNSNIMGPMCLFDKMSNAILKGESRVCPQWPIKFCIEWEVGKEMHIYCAVLQTYMERGTLYINILHAKRFCILHQHKP